MAVLYTWKQTRRPRGTRNAVQPSGSPKESVREAPVELRMRDRWPQPTTGRTWRVYCEATGRNWRRPSSQPLRRTWTKPCRATGRKWRQLCQARNSAAGPAFLFTMSALGLVYVPKTTTSWLWLHIILGRLLTSGAVHCPSAWRSTRPVLIIAAEFVPVVQGRRI